MKLIDILATEMPVWPENTLAFFSWSGKLDRIYVSEHCVSMVGAKLPGPSRVLTEQVAVTKAEWEKARAALQKPAIDWDSAPDGYPL